MGDFRGITSWQFPQAGAVKIPVKKATVKKTAAMKVPAKKAVYKSVRKSMWNR